MKICFSSSISEISPAEWDNLWPTNYPFTRHAFLSALENSGCVQASTGWQPHHCTIRNELDELIAAIPLYIKFHSYGEYVFDWAWANAYEEHQITYYPKLLNAIPFTPATGNRWAISETLSPTEHSAIQSNLLSAIELEAQKLNCSGIHILFTNNQDHDPLLKSKLWLRRFDCQYHWFNQGAQNFEGFLQTFNSRKRKTIKKERMKISEQSIDVQFVRGSELNESDWLHFYHLYKQTYLKRSGHTGYLNQSFFLQLGRTMASQILISKAIFEQRWVAAALYFIDNDNLYGRYWGCLENFDALHFECCYYQGVEFALTHGLQRFDPGAQGEHKITRGFQPVLTNSYHWIQHPGFRQAIQHFLLQETNGMLAHCKNLRARLPFKEGTPEIDSHTLIKGDLFLHEL